MARQKGLLKVVGKLDDLSFYKSEDGYLVRTKGGVSGSRIANDPAFQRTKENNAEFGMAGKAGKLLRLAFRNLMMEASDRLVTSRMSKLMNDVKKLDAVSGRGQRHVHAGFGLPEGKAVLKGFNFNTRSDLSGILFKPYALNTSSGTIDIKGLVPATDISVAPGATHVSFTGGWAKVDFESGTFVTSLSNAFNLPISSSATDVGLSHTTAPTLATGIDVFVLLVEFFQEVNGVQYSLKNGGYNSLAVIEVA